MNNQTTEFDDYFIPLYETYNYSYDDSSKPCSKEGIKNFGSHFLPTLYSLVFLLGLVGNSLVILVLFKYKRLKSMTDVYLLNLAISDLLFVFSLPFWSYYAAYQWVFGDGLCKIISWIYLVGFYSGIFFIMLMSIDRYLAIVHAVLALRARTVTYGIFTSLIVWLVAILASVPELIFSESYKERNHTNCKPRYPGNSTNWRIFSSLEVNILGLIIPSVVMIFCYSMIIKTLLYCRSEKKNKAVKMIFAVMIVFFVFWTPYNIVLFLQLLVSLGVITKCETSKDLDYAMQGTETLAFFHCCLNPVIYFFMGEKFKKYVKLLFKSWAVPRMFFKRCGLLTTYHTESTSSFHTQSTGDQDAL
ncbi:C-C chemokine receptor type 4 [Platysternon megacephalum]|uniref:C-C chemokine receptor type 4 n=1 Tax=Platysternon megacephalum TaxID=55544 RepID=A0A4D9E1C9_9SAUR|nr:C-C chemokine receptor type 4 [Platysternon megacephalum]